MICWPSGTGFGQSSPATLRWDQVEFNSTPADAGDALGAKPARGEAASRHFEKSMRFYRRDHRWLEGEHLEAVLIL
jgi:hypothetical protein